MRLSVPALAALFGLGLISAPAALQQGAVNGKGGQDLTGEYDVVPGWPHQEMVHRRPGYIQGSMGGIFAESPNRVLLLSRGDLKAPDKLPNDFTGAWGSLNKGQATSQVQTAIEVKENNITVWDANGKLIEDWNQWDKLFVPFGSTVGPNKIHTVGAHSIKINPYDPEHHIWLIEDMRHQILEFSNDGKQLLRSLGEAGVPGNDDKHFARPTDIAWLPDGTFFVSDGYINTRVVKFDKTGKFLMAWGKPGKGPGEFNLPHSIALDKNRRVFVADRSNNRIQVFDENGKFLNQWPGMHPFNIMVSGDQYLWVVDGETHKFIKYDLDGKFLYSWGTQGTDNRGTMWGVHQFSVDSEGNVYIAETFGGRAQKFKPRPGADKAKLIQPVLLTPMKATR